MPTSFVCRTCGERHDGIPDLSFDAPLYYHQLSADEKSSIATLTSDLCTIAGEDFFIRGRLEIPIVDDAHVFTWGAWVTLSKPNFERYARQFNSPPPDAPANLGWFSNRLPGYPDTLNLKTRVHFDTGDLRPRFELEPTDHPLAVHQRNGISLAELQAIIEASLHPTRSVQ
ncbi:MAG TPA: DUF2199 domain-containing protein [Vicinamibacterales bacterium]